MNTGDWTWTREPKDYAIGEDRIEITTLPHTDLWQRTYYHFRNDNAPVLQMETDERYFSCRWRPTNGISVLWSRPISPEAITASTSAAW